MPALANVWRMPRFDETCDAEAPGVRRHSLALWPRPRRSRCRFRCEPRCRFVGPPKLPAYGRYAPIYGNSIAAAAVFTGHPRSIPWRSQQDPDQPGNRPIGRRSPSPCVLRLAGPQKTGSGSVRHSDSSSAPNLGGMGGTSGVGETAGVSCAAAAGAGFGAAGFGAAAFLAAGFAAAFCGLAFFARAGALAAFFRLAPKLFLPSSWRPSSSGQPSSVQPSSSLS
jgi:hypothetical protein